MIHFNLICKNKHQFDSWFASNSAFEDQQKAGLVTCPMCDSDQIEKQLMAPSIPSKSNRKTAETQQTMLSSAGDPKMKIGIVAPIDLRDRTRANVHGQVKRMRARSAGAT